MQYINNIDTEKRFDMVKFLNISEDFLGCLDSFVLLNIDKLSLYGTTYINGETQGRPDLLSYRIYGDTQYWWILLYYNNIIDPDDLIVGTQINYPSLGSIEYLYQRASILEKTK